MTGSSAVKLFAIGLLSSVATACSPIVAIHGNYIDPDRLGQIHEGISRKADVADILGTPTATSTFDPNVWYYIGQRIEKVAFFAPEVTDRQILQLRFDTTGVVATIEKSDLASGRDIDFVSRTTPTAGKDLSFLAQMLGNVGRFSGNKKEGGPPGR